MPQAFAEHPVEVMRRNCWVSPFWEGSVAEVVEWLGWDKVMFGSDYPHPEGLAEPCSYVDHLPEGLADDDLRKIMGGNLARIMRVEQAAAAV